MVRKSQPEMYFIFLRNSKSKDEIESRVSHLHGAHQRIDVHVAMVAI